MCTAYDGSGLFRGVAVFGKRISGKRREFPLGILLLYFCALCTFDDHLVKACKGNIRECIQMDIGLGVWTSLVLRTVFLRLVSKRSGILHVGGLLFFRKKCTL